MADDPGAALLAVARRAIAHELGAPEQEPPPPAPWPGGPRGCFVTLHDPAGALRGCIGHIRPQREQVAEEVAECARLAAFEDPRFRPLAAHELAGLRISISLLDPPEPLEDLTTLDPARYGVIVYDRTRRGVLLPAIDGVDTVADQLAIARRKAGIGPHERYQVQRFTVQHFAEPAPGRAGT
ncbi:MAG: AmmeMemoRadiSam system protein A [Deltaproteobacteria bacterium]|nr:AmmeMemoRadiSam system protein A [Deltaproteobacteria bacterium]MCB9789181.1 AmmeMemoRadiSam system protein A [Deltaproteobacteria bacterium]